MAALAQLERDLAQAKDDVNTCEQMLQLEPNDEDAKLLKAQREQDVATLQQQIAAKKVERSLAAPPPPPPDADGDVPPPPPPAKFDMSKHPKFAKKPHDLADDVAQQTVFEVKDHVMAKWSGDKQWYHAVVVTTTGSAADPVYTVTFKIDGTTETKRKHEIRPYHNDSKKRKADGPPVISAPQMPASPKPAASGHVITAAPSVDTSLVQPKREPSKVSDGPTRLPPEPKKLKGNKALEKGKADWKAWSEKGMAKVGAGGLPKNKDSMFRTPNLPNAKVGFTGSGKGMQKDQARFKWNYDKNDETQDQDE
jgi:survival of motor neuron-related-splicing factor 30